MAKSMNGQLRMFSPETSEASSSAISSPAAADGLRGFVGLHGQTIVSAGLEAVLVSRGATPTYGRVAAKATPIRGIFGLRGFGSYASAALQSSLENKLRQRFAVVGSTKCSATWNQLGTPAGRLVYLRAVSEQIMVGGAYGGWPTPTARDGKDISRSNAFLSQRQRHSPSLATRLLERGVSWQAVTPIYCLAMGYPLSWNETRSACSVTRSSRKSRKSSSKRI